MDNKNKDQNKKTISASGRSVGITTLDGNNSYDLMDTNNKNISDIMVSQGMDCAVESMFKHPKTGKPMTWGEMRSFYG